MKAVFTWRVLWKSTLLGGLIFGVLSLVIDPSTLGSILDPAHRPDDSPWKRVDAAAMRVPLILGMLYFRPPCASVIQMRCPYAQPPAERKDLALLALQAQLQSQAVDLPDVDLAGLDLRDVRYLLASSAGCDDCGKTKPGRSSAADWNGANLSDSKLLGANLSGLQLQRASLARAVLSGANLQGADLSFADLSDADLSGAGLEGADLTGAELRGAQLTRARLDGANLASASDLTPQHVAGCVGDDRTRLPPGLARPSHWPKHSHVE